MTIFTTLFKGSLNTKIYGKSFSTKPSIALKGSKDFPNNTFEADRKSSINILCNFLLEYNIQDQSHFKAEDASGWEERKGKFFHKNFNSGKPEIRELNYYEVLNTNIICFGGIEFDSISTHAAIIKSVENLIRIREPKELEKNNIRIASYQPIYNRKDRYNHLLKYSLDNTYTPAYMIDFAKKYIFPKIRRTKGYNINKPILTLYSFSAGGREIMMLENALRYLLKEADFSDVEICDVFQCINSVSIGYAFQFNYNPLPRFRKLIVYGIEDLGVLVPTSLFINVFNNEKIDVASRPFTIVERNYDSRIEFAETYILLGRNMIEKYMEGKPKNESGHALPNYVEESINKKLPDEISQPIRNLMLLKHSNNEISNNTQWENKVLASRIQEALKGR